VLPLTFDWAQIAYIGSPLVVPFWAAMNIVGGLVLVMWILAPILCWCCAHRNKAANANYRTDYTNTMYSSYMPILSAAVFDNTGKPYDVSKILTDNFLFDKDAYESYSRVFLPITYVLSYALQFAALAALFTHTACWHGKDIMRQWKRSWREIRSQKIAPTAEPVSDGNSNSHATDPRTQRSRSLDASLVSEPGLENLMASEDVHNRLMRRYDDVPVWWYVLTGISMTAVGMFIVE
jgi:hypothetical protein